MGVSLDNHFMANVVDGEKKGEQNQFFFCILEVSLEDGIVQCSGKSSELNYK